MGGARVPRRPVPPAGTTTPSSTAGTWRAPCWSATPSACNEFEIVEIEEFTGEIRNPDTGRPSQTFVMAGKADGIVRAGGELYLLEHKTAGSVDANYLDKLWTGLWS